MYIITYIPLANTQLPLKKKNIYIYILPLVGCPCCMLTLYYNSDSIEEIRNQKVQKKRREREYIIFIDIYIYIQWQKEKTPWSPCGHYIHLRILSALWNDPTKRLFRLHPPVATGFLELRVSQGALGHHIALPKVNKKHKSVHRLFGLVFNLILPLLHHKAWC